MKSPFSRGARALLAVAVAPLGLAAAQDPAFRPLRFGDPEDAGYDVPYFPGGHDASVPSPDTILGAPHGSRMAHHEEVLECFRVWSEASPRLQLFEHGRTHEGRALVHAVISSPENLARLDAIRADVARLADPRGLGDGEAREVLERTPAIAWMGYSIHGDEVSGADAAVALAWHLIASTEADVARLLERVVVVVDPLQNPDGRERILGMVEQSAGRTLNLDYASMHRGRWPYGRGNHYLFDLNRDWMAGTQPETRARWRAITGFHPQLLVDAHEMGPDETYLFYPQAEPLNPWFPENLIAWQKRYAAGAAVAFDAHGWSYYTREWADGWAPFYTDAWGSLLGAIGLLYEQAGISGFPLRRSSGVVMTYRETVHHQAVASLANLTTLSENKEAVLADYLRTRRRNVAEDGPGNDRMFVWREDAGGARSRWLLRTLREQGIEVSRVDTEFEARGVVHCTKGALDSATVSPGSYVVRTAQPEGALVKAFLAIESRLDEEALKREREDLERKGESRIYDSTSWSLPLALGIDGAWCDAVVVDSTPVDWEGASETVLAEHTDAPIAWAVDGRDDSAVTFAAQALELGLVVAISDEPFRVAESPLERGSLLVRTADNPGPREAIEARVLEAARRARVPVVHRAGTGLSADDGPDLGGQHFRLLARPRVAVLTNAPVEPDLYGHLWYYLDTVLGIPFTLVDAQLFGSYDLRRYNVLVLPPAGGRLEGLLEPHAEALGAWIEGGGTLIACADAAAALTSGALGLSEVTLRRDALTELDAYRRAAERERAAREIAIDAALLWDGAPEGSDESADDEDEDGGAEEDEDEEAARERDLWERRFSPRGAMLRGIVDGDAWITAGTGDELPVLVDGSWVFLSKAPVRTPVRLAAADRLRISGLLWPEARGRLAESAWLTVESSGHGQIVLFATLPGFRGSSLATARLFGNAVVYGPGLGASQPQGW